MNWRYWRRIRLFRGGFLNVSKNGVSFTVTLLRVFHVTFGRNGVRFSFGVRGTGLSFNDYKKYK